MISISSLYTEAQLAEASYADLTGTQAGSTITDPQQVEARLVAEGFSAVQAAAFVSEWRVVDHIPDTDSGFSATLFERLSGSTGTGQFSLAIRGSTDWLTDFAADGGDIFLDGIAQGQLVDLYNYWQRLSARSGGSYDAKRLVTLTTETVALNAAYALSPVAGLAYETILRARADVIIDNPTHTVRTIQPVNSSTLSDASLQNGVADALPVGLSALDVSGHSLGGHLAMAFTRLFPSLDANAVGVNGLGFRPSNSNVDHMFALLGGAAAFDAAKVYNVYGLEGPEFAAQNTWLLNQVGGYQGIYIENGGLLTSTYGGHAADQMTDSLALYDIFAKIDPALNTTDPAHGINKITGLLKAASNQAPETLERMVDAFVNFFDLDYVPLTGTLTDNREEFYQRVVKLQELTSTASLTIDDLTGMAAADLANIAQGSEALAYRYALKELNPFAVVGNNDLYAEHNANGELNLYKWEDGTGTLTTRWLEDRAKFLTTKIGINTNDQIVGINPFSNTSYWYQDEARGESAYVLSSDLSSARRNLRRAASIEALLKNTEAERVFFGTDAPDSGITGGANADALYGNGGDDRLIGLGGDDYLQGDAGWDRLYGGDGNDELVGGKDDDLLNGGSGNDTYTWNTGDGLDTIVDEDGAGKIMFAGVDLTGAYEQKGEDPKIFGNADFTLTWNGKLTTAGSPEGTAWLTIAKDADPSGTIRILGFDSATTFLGINLNGVPSTQVFTDLSGTNANDTLGADASFQKVHGLDGNDRITVSTAGAVAYGGTGTDYITNDAGAQKLYGEEGNDILVASDGNDELYGGLDNDALQGGADDDYLEGNEGNDFVDGGAGSDVLMGGEGSDVLLGGGSMVPYIPAWDPENIPEFGVLVTDGVAGGTGMVGYFSIVGDEGDVLDGGAGNDTLFAGGGDDLLKGGADDDLMDGQSGNDTLYGGDGADSLIGDGSPGNSIIIDADFYTLPQFHGDDYLDGGAGDDILFGDGGSDALYGGEGNDNLVGDANGLDAQYHGADYLDGGAGDDQLFGGGKDDTLIGGAGDDTLYGDNGDGTGTAGDDYLDGGDGDDTLWGEGGDDTLIGGIGEDKLYGAAGANYLDGGNGNDLLNSGGPGSELFGGAGDDQISAAGGGNYLDGEEGTDTLTAVDGNNTLFGGAGDDNLSAGGGNNTLDGEEGNNTLLATGGGNTLFAGAGNDTLSAAGGSNYLDGGNGTNTLAANGGGNTLYGGSGDDTLSSAGGGNYLDGGGGTNLLIADGGGNTLISGAGDDTLSSAGGNSTLDGGGGNDTLIADGGGNTLLGGAGNDLTRGGDGNDNAFGGEGDDIILGQAGDDLLAGDDGNDELQGGAGDDRLDGGAGDDRLYGDEGNDVLIGGDGENYYDGGPGDDDLYGGARPDRYYWQRGDGVDRIYDTSNGAIGANTLRLAPGTELMFSLVLRWGSLMLDFGSGDAIHLENFDPDNVAAGAGIDQFVFEGVDTLSYKELIARGFDLDGTPDADTIYGTSASDRINALAGDDVVSAKRGEDVIDLGAGDDIGYGGDGDDVVYGGEGADLVFGDAGEDYLDGGAGDDTLDGGSGNDTLSGGEGADTMAGGAGNDVYIVDAEDSVIENAGAGHDTIRADFSYTLGANFEELDLDGNDAIDGSGNELDNVVRGNGGDNLLFGLAGNDTLYGGSGSDTLEGGAGDDTLFGDDGGDLLLGGDGADFMAGGAGDDAYIVDDAHDIAFEQDVRTRLPHTDEVTITSNGNDTVQASFSYTLGHDVENLVLTGAQAIDGHGNLGANQIVGNDADNVLTAYALNGRSDNRVQFGTIFLTPHDGVQERLNDRAAQALYAGEILQSELDTFGIIDLGPRAGDTLIGGGGNDTLLGDWDNDTLIGGEGDDLLFGLGGADTLVGGAGDDTYVVDRGYSYFEGFAGSASLRYEDYSDDVLIENPGEGTDTVLSRIDLELGDNFENLTLILDTSAWEQDSGVYGSGSDNLDWHIAQVGIGNALDNVITGNAANNELYGNDGNDTLIGGAGDDLLDGGSGADFMAGGGGNDIYQVDDAGDVVSENETAGSGIDLVESSIDYTLTAGVENLTLFGNGDNLSGTGNELNNVIVGDDDNNVLKGLAGNDFLDGLGGDDVMEGSVGADEYLVDSTDDVVIEAANEGYDTVYASTDFALGDNIEALYLEGWGYTEGIGNDLDNLIVGSDDDNYLEGLGGNDVINGGDGYDEIYGDEGSDIIDGGAGEDYMEGGAGDDTYYVDDWADEVYEAPDEGRDTVYSAIEYSLTDDVEDLTLVEDFQGDMYSSNTGWGEGNELDNHITGSDTSNNLSGFDGNDLVDGRAGADRVYGGGGDDTLYGGDDVVFAEDSESPIWGDEEQIGTVTTHIEILSMNDDRLYGETGNDAIDGGSGDDWIYGDDGDDQLYGGDDGIAIVGERYYAADGEVGELFAAMSGGDPDDVPSRFYYGDSRFDQIDIAGPLFLGNDDYIDGGSGKDYIDGGSGNDELYGGDGDDTLIGGADGPLNTDNDDYLDGGAGIDYMAGGTGDDVYYVDGFYTETTDIPVYGDCGNLIPGAVTRVWTTDTVFESADQGFDEVWSFADFTLPDNVEYLQLLWGSEARIGRGNALDNSIVGNNNANRLEGGAGDDYLYGDWGNDVLDGGAGNDALVGGAGDDTYNLGYGAGQDTVFNYGGGADSVHVVQGIAAGDITLSRNGNDVVIGLKGTQDRVTLADWFGSATPVSRIVFCDGSALDANAIATLANSHVLEIGRDAASVQEDGTPIATGNVLDNDTDSLGHTLSVANPGTVAGTYGTLTLSADGNYTYTLDNDAAQWLVEGESVTDTFGYVAGEPLQAYLDGVLDITIVGQNDAPLSSFASGVVAEDALVSVDIPGGNAVTNGGFETGDFFGWSLTGDTSYTGVDDAAPHSGGLAAYIGSAGSYNVLSQNIATVAGERYSLEFWLDWGGSTRANFNASWNGVALVSLVNTYLDDYAKFTYEVVADGSDSLLEFTLRNDLDYWGLDDVALIGGPMQIEVLPSAQSTGGSLAFSDADLHDSHDVFITAEGADYIGGFDAWVEQDSYGSGSGSIAWDFTVDNDELQFLAEGETLTQSYAVTIDDGQPGGSAMTVIAVDLVGANDAPEIIYADSSGELGEGEPVQTMTGEIDFADVDLADAHSVTVQAADSGYLGSFDAALTADSTGYGDGWLDWTFTVGNSAIDYLAEGEQLEQTYEVAIGDGHAAAMQTVTVIITGTNDAPIVDAASGTVTEDAAPDARLVAGDNLLVNAGFENGDMSGWNVAGSTDQVGVDNASFSGDYAGLFGAIGADGILSQDVQTIAGREYLLDFRLMGGSDMGSDFSVSWNGETLSSFADVSLPDYTEFQFAVRGVDGLSRLEFALRNDVDFWRLDDIAVRELPPGVLVPHQETTSGSIVFADTDLGDMHDMDAEAAAPGYAGTFSLAALHDSTGSGTGAIDWSFTVEDREIQYLAEGEAVTQHYDVTVYDDYASSMGSSGVTVTINGANDAPEITYAESQGGVGEDAVVWDEEGNPVVPSVQTATGEIDFADVDRTDAHIVTVQAAAGGYVGSLDAEVIGDSTVVGDGWVQWTFSAGNSELDYLAEGELLQQTYSVIVDDGHAGGTATQAVTVSIWGANDAPVTQDDAASVQEDLAPLAAGNVLANDSDVDHGTLLRVTAPRTFIGAYGTLSLSADGSYSYALDNGSPEVQALAAGQQVGESFTYAASDGLVTASGMLTLAISGTNDAPVAQNDAVGIQEDATLAASGNVLANDGDVDSGAVLSVAAPDSFTGAYGTLNLEGNGGYTYTLGNTSSAVQGLRAGQSATDVFGYAASDGTASTAATITINVTGTNDAPVAHNDTGAAQEDGGTVTLAAAVLLDNDTDADVGDTRAITAVTGSAAGATVSLVDGNAVYDPGTLFQSLKAGAAATDSFSYTMADGQGVTSMATVTMNVTGANDAPVVANAIADQSAAAGSLFGFSVAANTFFDIDAGDALVYAATLADGAPLPEWLSFDAATRTFTGTPPGGADCGGGTASSLQLRVDATDMAGASAFDEFALNISGGGSGGGQTIIGTDHGDVLVGTSCDDIIDGRKGFDKMSGGKGDDVYYVDETCSSGGRHGNEGVGNGEDPPPPGHDHNHNDGPGTSPGNPGSRHGGKNHADGGHDDDHDGSGHGGNGHGGGKHDDDDDDDDHGGPDHGKQCRVDEVIENADAGYDSVYSSADYTLTANVEELHLIGGDNLSGHGNALDNIVVGNSGDNALYGEAGDDLLMDDAGDDTLYGGAGKDVLDGGAGDDKLLGGAGDDIYVHGLGGGDDVVQESGGQDTIRFGEGIAASAVSVLRSRDDLVLKLSSRNGSVTVKNWFSGSASRVERVQFADGSAWNEAQVRARVGRGSSGGSSGGGSCDTGHDDGRSSRRDNGGSGHDSDRNDGERHDGGRHDDRAKYGDARDAIAARLEKSPNYDFTSLSAYLAQHQGGGYGALTAAQVAQQWRSVQVRVAQLAQDDEDARHGAHGGEHYGGDDGFARGAMFWGHSGSTGQNRGYGGMATFGGLDEGFRKLG